MQVEEYADESDYENVLPMPAESHRKVAAILRADAVGYSRLMQADESATVETLNAYREAMRRLGMLADAGIPLGCQTVLLRGVNDDVDVMKRLMQKLLAARVRPYYTYMCDNVAGVEHFKTSVEKGLEIVEGLRGWTSGLAVPHFVIDAPGGGGKIPLLPEYVVRLTDEEIVLRNFRGQRYVWKQPQREPEEVAATGTDGSVVPIRGKGGKPKKKRTVRTKGR